MSDKIQLFMKKINSAIHEKNFLSLIKRVSREQKTTDIILNGKNMNTFHLRSMSVTNTCISHCTKCPSQLYTARKRYNKGTGMGKQETKPVCRGYAYLHRKSKTLQRPYFINFKTH